MAARPKHPKKEVEDAVAYAEAQGWTWLKVHGHAWGKLYCKHHDRDGCTEFVWSTPRSPATTQGRSGARSTDARTRRRRSPMKTFEFSVVASGLDPEAEGFADRFFEAGCDDATVGFQKGHIILDFARDAACLDEAIASAVAAVTAAGAKVDRVEPDPLVSLSDIAARTGMSRAAMSLYAKGERGRNFPAPVARVTSESPLWDWSSVARWMFENDKVDRGTALEAEIVRYANTAIGDGKDHIADRLKQRAAEYDAELEAA